MIPKALKPQSQNIYQIIRKPRGTQCPNVETHRCIFAAYGWMKFLQARFLLLPFHPESIF